MTNSENTELTAPMPGVIVQFKKRIGETVLEGEPILVIEAMKMENDIPAPIGGILKEIYYKKGDSVATGDVLCIIE